MNLNAEQIQGAVVAAVRGLVDAAGPPSAEVKSFPDPAGDGVLVAVREGYEVQKHEGRKRGRRLHGFRSIRSFGQWLRRHADPGKVEILGDGEKISAALAPADPDGDLVTCQLEVHPRAKPWLEALKPGKKLTQRELWLFVRARPQDFSEKTTRKGTDLGSYGPILAAELQKLEVNRGGKLRTELDSIGNVLFSAGEEKTEVSGSLPSSFDIRIPLLRDVVLFGTVDPAPYEPVYTLEVFLTMQDADEGKRPAFSLEAPGLETAQIQAREDALKCLREELASESPEGYLVGLGSVSLVSVPDRTPTAGA